MQFVMPSSLSLPRPPHHPTHKRLRQALFEKFQLNLFLGLSIITLVGVLALVSLFWLPYDPNASDWSAQLAAPSAKHWLGTDHLARDIFSRLLVGARSTIYVGMIAVSIAIFLGCSFGLLAALSQRWLDEIIMRIVDIFLAFPAILLALLLAAIYEPSRLTAMVAIGLATTPVFARLMRAEVLSLKNEVFIEAARALGTPFPRLLWAHILPNTLAPMIVQASLSLAVAVLAEAALSFLGLGAPETVPSWGIMLREAQGFMGLSLYPALIPGLAIVLTVLGWGLLGDGLRDRFA